MAIGTSGIAGLMLMAGLASGAEAPRTETPAPIPVPGTGGTTQPAPYPAPQPQPAPQPLPQPQTGLPLTTIDPLLVQQYLRNSGMSNVGATSMQVGGVVTLAGIITLFSFGITSGDTRVIQLGEGLTAAGAIATLGGLGVMDAGSILATRNLSDMGRRVTVVPGYLSAGFLGAGLIFGGMAWQQDGDLLFTVLSGLSLFGSYYTGDRAWSHQRAVGADLRQMQMKMSAGPMWVPAGGDVPAGGTVTAGTVEMNGAGMGGAGMGAGMGGAGLDLRLRPGLYLSGVW